MKDPIPKDVRGIVTDCQVFRMLGSKIPSDAERYYGKLGKKYTRIPVDCEKCRREHGVSPFHYGPDKDADCGKCIADSIFLDLKEANNV